MSSMESFIVVVSLIASAMGVLILLASLAGKKAQLVKAFTIQLEVEARERDIQDRINSKKTEIAPIDISHGKEES